jgi:chromatin modification-related protein EAF6
MAENVPPAGGASGSNGDVPGQPFYDKARNHLKDLLEQRNKLGNNLSTLEDRIYAKETDYLEGTPSGNIVKGFENYTKGTGSSAPGQRRRVPVNNEDRLFSRSSHTYNLNAVSFYLIFFVQWGRAMLIEEIGIPERDGAIYTHGCAGSYPASDEFSEG